MSDDENASGPAPQESPRILVGNPAAGPDYLFCPGGSQSTTLAAYAQGWLRAIAPTVKPLAVESFETDLWRHVLPAFGALEIGLLKEQRVPGEYVEAFVREKSKAGLSKHKLQQCLNILNDLVAYALQGGTAPPSRRNPFGWPMGLKPVPPKSWRVRLWNARSARNGAARALERRCNPGIARACVAGTWKDNPEPEDLTLPLRELFRLRRDRVTAMLRAVGSAAHRRISLARVQSCRPRARSRSRCPSRSHESARAPSDSDGGDGPPDPLSRVVRPSQFPSSFLARETPEGRRRIAAVVRALRRRRRREGTP